MFTYYYPHHIRHDPGPMFLGYNSISNGVIHKQPEVVNAYKCCLRGQFA